MSTPPSDAKSDPRETLRLLLATLAYRARKALIGAPPGFGPTRASADTRSALEILAHIGDLMDWAAQLARDAHEWKEPKRKDWNGEVERFFAATARLDSILAAEPISDSAQRKLVQGPLADALTHVGQINVLRRIAGAPVRGESYAQAEIQIGRVGMDQAEPVKEFD